MDWLKKHTVRLTRSSKEKSTVASKALKEADNQAYSPVPAIRGATLCVQCRSFLETVDRDGNHAWKTLHQTFASFRTAVELDCHFCAELWLGLTPTQLDHLANQPSEQATVLAGLIVRTNADGANDEYSVTLHTSRLTPDRRRATQRLWLGKVAANQHCFPDYGSGPSTAARSSLDMALSWYLECAKHHPGCSAPRPDSYRGPARLVDIRPTQASDWRLYHARPSKARKLQYMALSHCWGKASFLKLTASSHDAMVAGLPIDALPKTFRDAIHIARYIGFDFLWIDSLCIIQDSVEDWRKESAIMQEIYRYSACTIAATAATNGDEGCFSSRDARFAEPASLCIRWADEIDECEYLVMNHEYVTRQVTQAPLNKRAWVMQERILSPRILHFGQSQIFWECSETLACETFPRELPRHFLTGSIEEMARTCTSTLSRSDCSSPEERRRELYDMWSELVAVYAGCALTMPQDKLVALSGLAEGFSEALGNDDYLAGLWKGNLPHDLMWSVVDPNHYRGSEPGRPASYRAPSWSWASIDATISMESIYLHRQDTVLVDCLEAWVQKLSASPTGEVSAGLLRLRARLLPADYDPRHKRILRAASTSFEADLKFDCPEAGSVQSALVLVPIRLHFDSVEGLILRQQPSPGYKDQAVYQREGVWDASVKKEEGPVVTSDDTRYLRLSTILQDYSLEIITIV